MRGAPALWLLCVLRNIVTLPIFSMFSGPGGSVDPNELAAILVKPVKKKYLLSSAAYMRCDSLTPSPSPERV